MKKTFAAVCCVLMLFLFVMPDVFAMSQTLVLSSDPQQTMYISISDSILTVGDVTDTETCGKFMLILYGKEKRYSVSAETDTDCHRAIMVLPKMKDGEYITTLSYASLESPVYTLFLTIKLTVSGKNYYFAVPDTLEINTKLREKADGSSEAMRYYSYFSSESSVKNTAVSIAGELEEYDAARAIYNWICTNMYLIADNDPQSVDAAKVLSEKTATSRGFAALCAQMLRAVSIPVRTVKGTCAVNDPVAWTDGISGKETVYSYWLEVYVDGKWITIDPALGTYNSYNDGVKKRGTGIMGLYFDPSDLFFAQSHMTLEYESVPACNGYERINDITLINGTQKSASAFGLPESITAFTSLGEVTCAVVWDVKSCSYDENGTEKQVFTVSGTLEFPDEFSFLQDTAQQVTASVTVNARVLLSVSVKTEPDTTVFFQGDTVDPQGLELYLTYDNGKSVSVFDGYTITCDTSSTGIKTVTVQYGDFSTEYNVRVLSASPISLEITEPMTKTVYYTGDKLDTTGLKLSYCCEGGHKFDVDEYETEYDFSKAGECDVVFSFGDLTASQTVNVIQLAAVSAIVAELPHTTVYRYGEKPDFSGLVLEVTYNDGSVKTVSDDLEFSYMLPDGTADAEFEVTVRYGGVSAQFTALVLAQEIISQASMTALSEESESAATHRAMTTWEIVSAFIAALIAALVVAGFVDKWQTMKKLRDFMKEHKK